MCLPLLHFKQMPIHLPRSYNLIHDIMRVFLLSIILFCALGVKSERLLDVVTYDARTQDEFVYSNTFTNLDDSEYLEFNLPFADHFYLNGHYVEFTISKEMALRYFCRDHEEESSTTFDLQISICTKLSPLPWSYSQQQTDAGILRIIILH